jgi:hypothetical protein
MELPHEPRKKSPFGAIAQLATQAVVSSHDHARQLLASGVIPPKRLVTARADNVETTRTLLPWVVVPVETPHPMNIRPADIVHVLDSQYNLHGQGTAVAPVGSHGPLG